jgi:hypothetical protein
MLFGSPVLMGGGELKQSSFGGSLPRQSIRLGFFVALQEKT